MEKLLSIKTALLSFTIFPFGFLHENTNSSLEKQLEKYQNTNQETDKESLLEDWKHIGGDIADALNKVSNEC